MKSIRPVALPNQEHFYWRPRYRWRERFFALILLAIAITGLVTVAQLLNDTIPLSRVVSSKPDVGLWSNRAVAAPPLPFRNPLLKNAAIPQSSSSQAYLTDPDDRSHELPTGTEVQRPRPWVIRSH